MKRPVVLGAAAVVVAIALGVGLVVANGMGGDAGNGTASGVSTNRAGSSTTTTTRRSTEQSSTTTTTTTTPTPGTSTSPARNAPDPRDPPDPGHAYAPKPLPAGVSATISTCRWVPDGGGELQAEGTITNTAGADDFWLISVYWLQRNQTQNEDVENQTDIMELAVGQTLPWHLKIAASSAPPDLSCAFEVE